MNALDTIRRSRACRGSSMLIIDPKYTASHRGHVGHAVGTRPELNTAAFLLASDTSAWRTRA